MACLRGGELTEQEQKAWYDQWSREYDLKNPFKPASPTIAVKKETKRAASRPRRAARAKRPDAVSNQLTVPGQQLPVPGEVIEGHPNSTWGPSTVGKLMANFVHVDALPRVQTQLALGKLTLLPGMFIEVRMPPMDDEVVIHPQTHTSTHKYTHTHTMQVLQVQVLATGLVWNTKANSGNNKTRVVVFRRRPSTKKTWGTLETLSAAAFPDASHCKVLISTD